MLTNRFCSIAWHDDKTIKPPLGPHSPGKGGGVNCSCASLAGFPVLPLSSFDFFIPSLYYTPVI